MELNCRHISITDEEFGCTILFSSEKEESVQENNPPIEELINNPTPYIMLQRTYGEDDFDDDYYYIETNDPGESRELKDFMIEIYRNRITIIRYNKNYEINTNINNVEFENLKSF